MSSPAFARSQSYDVRIEPSGPLGGYLSVPPSKNYTTRLILAASLAEGRSEIHRPATNDDARALVRCCRALGATIEENTDALTIQGVAGRPRNPAVLNPDNAGAVLRLLLGVVCLIDGEVRFETSHTESLGRRPNEDLLKALRMLGAEAEGRGAEGTLPIILRGGLAKLTGHDVSVSGARSSQFLSSLLFLAPMLTGPTEIKVSDTLVSRPLIDQTLEVLHRFGIVIDATPDAMSYSVPGGQIFKAGEHSVNGDWPSVAALLAAVAVDGGMVGFTGLQNDAQGERRAQDALTKMGCKFSTTDTGQLFIHSKAELKAIEFNGDLATDSVLALVGVACLAEGTSRFANIGNMRIKETDRIKVPLDQLARIGVQSRSGDDWIEITGRREGYEGGVEVDCSGDHRIAQLLAIVGTRCAQGLTLRGAQCVSKSHPSFFDDLTQMGVKLQRTDR